VDVFSFIHPGSCVDGAPLERRPAYELLAELSTERIADACDMLRTFGRLQREDRGGVSRNGFCGAAFACLFSSTFTITLEPNTPMSRQA
jgi:hypothetical protein